MVQAIVLTQSRSFDRTPNGHVAARRRAVAVGTPRSAFATAPERGLASLGALLNGGGAPVAQRVKAYEHNRKLYYNDEDREPPPQGYVQVDATAFDGGRFGAWSLSSPAPAADYGYIMEELIGATETDDSLRQAQLQAFIGATLNEEDVAVFRATFEDRLHQRQMEREAPDDRDYYLSYLDMEDPSASDYAFGLLVGGVPGASTLMEQYEGSTGAARTGFEKQIEVTRRIQEERGLRAVEQNQSDITPQQVFVSADIVTSDERGNEVLVEVKYWPGLESWPPPKQKQMVGQLIDQLTRYARTGKKVELHWLAALPDWLGALLAEVTRRTQGQIKIVTE